MLSAASVHHGHKPPLNVATTFITPSTSSPSLHTHYTSSMSMDAKSSDIKTSSRPSSRNQPTSDIAELHARLRADPRFNPTPPSPWKRAALLLVVVFLLWLAYRMRKPIVQEVFEREVVHAQRSEQRESGSLTTEELMCIGEQILARIQVPTCGESGHHRDAQGRADEGERRGADHPMSRGWDSRYVLAVVSPNLNLSTDCIKSFWIYVRTFLMDPYLSYLLAVAVNLPFHTLLSLRFRTPMQLFRSGQYDSRINIWHNATTRETRLR